MPNRCLVTDETARAVMVSDKVIVYKTEIVQIGCSKLKKVYMENKLTQFIIDALTEILHLHVPGKLNPTHTVKDSFLGSCLLLLGI